MLDTVTKEEREKLSRIGQVPFRIVSPSDETAESALARLALKNGCKSIHQFINRIPGLDRIDWNKRAVATLLVSKLADRPHWSVEEATPIVFRGCAELGRFRGPGKRGEAQFCAMCLRADSHTAKNDLGIGPYVRSMWYLQVPRYCHRHASLMTQKCPSCEKPCDVLSIVRTRCVCGYCFLDEKPDHLIWRNYVTEATALSAVGRRDFFKNGSKLRKRPTAGEKKLDRQLETWKLLDHEARRIVYDSAAARLARDNHPEMEDEQPDFQNTTDIFEPSIERQWRRDFADYVFAIMQRLSGKEFPQSLKTLDLYPAEMRNKLLRSFEHLETTLCAPLTDLRVPR